MEPAETAPVPAPVSAPEEPGEPQTGHRQDPGSVIKCAAKFTSFWGKKKKRINLWAGSLNSDSLSNSGLQFLTA